jgi:uncharacterized protein (DUF58 family)
MFKNLGLTREEVKHFLTSRGTLTLRVGIPKRSYRIGEEFEVTVHVDNQSSKKINSCYCYILKTETMMQIITTSKGVIRKVQHNMCDIGVK